MTVPGDASVLLNNVLCARVQATEDKNPVNEHRNHISRLHKHIECLKNKIFPIADKGLRSLAYRVTGNETDVTFSVSKLNKNWNIWHTAGFISMVGRIQFHFMFYKDWSIPHLVAILYGCKIGRMQINYYIMLKATILVMMTTLIFQLKLVESRMIISFITL